MAQWFKPLRRKVVEREVLGFDVEGSGAPGSFVCGSIQGVCTSNFFTDRREMWRALLYYGRNGAWLFSHNLEYDLPVLAGEEVFKGQLLFTRGGILWGVFGQGNRRARFFDSLNLFPRFSAKALGQLVAIPKLEVPAELTKRLALGLPFSSFSQPEQLLIQRYCERDAEIVYRSVTELQDLALALGSQLKPTIAGVAMDLYRRKYHRWPWLALGKEANDLARPAYYGGRVEAFQMGEVEGVNAYDVNSLYPWVQSLAPFPHPSHLKLLFVPPPAGSWWSWEGVALVTVEVPEEYVPPLPYRYKGRLFFPTGRLRALWTIGELREAIASGVKFVSVEWVFGSEVTFNPFAQFVEELFARRAEYLARSDVRANLVKLVLNSLYGRFGLNPEGGLERLVPIDEHTDFEKLEGYTSLEIAGELVARGPVQSLVYPAYVNTLFASQITGLARAHLTAGLRAQGEASVYCDTDSILTTGQIETREGLGGWRCEMERGKADLLGPKEYALYQEGHDPIYKVKGIPEYERANYLATGQARFFRAVSIRESLGGNLKPSAWVEVQKSRGDVLPKRVPLAAFALAPGGSTLTRPFALPELERMGLQEPKASSLFQALERVEAPQLILGPSRSRR